MKPLLSVLILATILSCNQKDSFKGFGKLSGLWQTHDGETDLYEEWSMPQNKIMHGKSYRMNDSDSLIEERVMLKQEGVNVYYIPTVSGQNDNAPTSFKLISSTDSSFTFENNQHDFPQRIIYRFVTTDSLVARIEGKVKGEERSKDYYYRRVQNYKPH